MVDAFMNEGGDDGWNAMPASDAPTDAGVAMQP